MKQTDLLLTEANDVMNVEIKDQKLLGSLKPLAIKMRPQSLEGYIGQQHLLAKNKPLAHMVEKKTIHSMVLYGPPGSGKTSLANILINLCNVSYFQQLSATSLTVDQIRKFSALAKRRLNEENQISVLFIDEIHRLTATQQDACLEDIEQGNFVLIGATTEHPGHCLVRALLSRVRIYPLTKLSEHELELLLQTVITNKSNGLGEKQLSFTEAAKQYLLDYAGGDARKLLNILEQIAVAQIVGTELTQDHVMKVIGEFKSYYGKDKNKYYDILSAFHKSVRGSNPDAALYWAASLITHFNNAPSIFRRLTAVASEDIGNAQPEALNIVINAWSAYDRLGEPEGLLALAQAITYCACAPKSNATYLAWKNALHDAQKGLAAVPLHLCQTQDVFRANQQPVYRYSHDEPNGFSPGQEYLPRDFTDKKYYYPYDRGLESRLLKILNELRKQNVSYKGKI